MNNTPESPWISVHDKLPDHLQPILFCFKDGEGDSSWYKYPATMNRGDFFRSSVTEASFRKDMRPVNNNMVSYWMPVPSSPYEKK